MIQPLRNWLYTVEERLGGGGYAQAYRCHNVAFPDGEYAIKVFNDSSYINTFEKEVRVLQTLKGCPSTPPLVDYGRNEEGKLCLVTGFVPGVRLDRHIRSSGPLSLDQTLTLIAQILVVLSYAHARGLLHKDIKASNILMDGDHFTLLDWGVGEPRSNGRSEAIRAKQDFVAPECYYGNHDFATDFYSLGWLTVYVLTGVLPYHFADIRDSDYRVVAHCLERPELPADIPALLRSLVLNWLGKKPENRLVGYDLPVLLAEAAGREPDFSWQMNLRQIQREYSYLHLAARHGIPYAQYQFALHLLKQERRDEAVYWLQQAREAGYVRATYRLARILAKGSREERICAEDLMQEAARAGHARAQYMVSEAKRRRSREGDVILLTPAQMKRVTGGRWRNLPAEGIFMTGVNYYLPWVKPGDLFIDLYSAEASVDKKVHRAFEMGAVAAMVKKDTFNSINRPLLEVDDTHKALQDLALASSLEFDGAKILVTGSHGKTGFKTQLFHVLNRQIPTHAHLDSTNKQNPIFRTLAAIPRKAKVAIVETAVPAAGIGEDRAFFIQPNFCVITGIGFEHLSSHKSVANLIMNKAAVVTGLRPGGKCILNADDPYFTDTLAAVRSYSDCEVIHFGSSADCCGQLISKKFFDFGWDVHAAIQGQEVTYRLPQIEDYAPLASVSVLLMAQLLGADIQQCARAFASYQNYESSGNLYQVELDNGSFHIYDQSRRGEWKGFESMFELMSRLTPKPGGRKIAVLTEFINLKDNPDAPVDLDRMGEMVKKSGLDLLFSVHQFKEHSSVAKPPINWIKHGETVEDIHDDLIAAINPHDMVFVRGIEDARLDKLVNRLLELGKSNKKIY